MSALCSTPHSISVITPKVTRNANNNVSEPDYVVAVGQATSRILKGNFQVRQGSRFVDDTGEKYLFDAVLYTFDKTITINDLITLPSAFPVDASGKYLVLSAEPKYDVDGIFDHTICRLVKESTR